MFAIAVIGFIALYVVVSLAIVAMASSFANKRGKRAWVWGGGAALVMFMIPFWDWLPTVVAHKYYCEREAGFWVYKTLDQWKTENPGVMESLVADKQAPQTQERLENGMTDTYRLNNRFNRVIIKQDISGLLPIMRFEQQVKDIKKNEVLARYVDFATGNSIMHTVGPPGPLKFWLHNRNCMDRGTHNDAQFDEFKHQFLGSQK